MNEKQYLKELAQRYLEIANLPVMDERADMWLRHNDGDKNCNPVLIETDTFQKDILPELKCSDRFNRELEEIMQSEISRYELVGDDRVVPKQLQLPYHIEFKQFDKVIERDFAGDIGYHTKPLIEDIELDLPKLKSSTYSFDRALNATRMERASEIISTEYVNTAMYWSVMHSKTVVDLMGMESFFIAMMDEPELVHQLFDFVAQDNEKYIKWQEKEGILTSNTGNDYAGAGSYGFTNQLSGEPVLSQMWGNMNSQESVGLSADMFGEFIFPYYRRMTDLFGKIYWGCCEPVEQIWDKYISTIPNLGKVSISAWCVEKEMGQKLANSKVIYSRKPSPNFVGVPDVFDEEAFKSHIQYTVDCARDCNIEIIMRDIYTLKGDKLRAKKAVDIARGLIKNR